MFIFAQSSVQTLLAFALFVFSHSSASAQGVQPVKTGDRLSLDLVRYEPVGRELRSTVTPLTARVDRLHAGHKVTYDTGRAETFDATHALIELSSGGRVTKFEGPQRFKWLPEDKDYKTTRTIKEHYTSNVCGATEATLEVVPTELRYKILLNGVHAEVTAIEFKMSGQWVAPCGTGRRERRVVFSPDLDLVLEHDNQTFDRQGFLFVGFGFRVKAVN